ncbi:hemolysin III family protein [Winogradskyella maritima]|uniref:Hemolysin III family protein n=1 Tax=Winogradskyella maritima TaxID=1517766 RepID=A0ABV8AGB8_9FLAO|nr:hemolysin III family protein [Winogradskyella maritima]
MRTQTKREEQLNTWTHAIGAILGVIGLILLLQKSNWDNGIELFSTLVYGLSVIILFSASAWYHAVSDPVKKRKLRIADHISIYVLIAGTYTPVVLILLSKSLGWPLFWAVWGITLFGIVLKLFFIGKFEIFSTLLYLVMGWLIVFDYTNLKLVMADQGINWLIAGGICYTVGIVFYVYEKLKYQHVIWHLYVLGGAFCHFMMVYYYAIGIV